jgi:3-deoxy-D-manno-octulosonic-acid transferase
MYALYSTLLALSLIVTLPYWVLQMLRHGKYRAGLRQRLGAVPPTLQAPGGRPAIWVHAVSVGEVVASSAVVEGLRREFPSHRVVISTTTSTGQKLAAKRFGTADVFYFPLDFALAVRPYLEAVHPELCVIAETEFWPNFLRLAKRSGARMAVVNCRISDRSFPRYRRMRFLLASVLANVDLFLTQTDTDRQRLVEIGAAEAKTRVAGNLKFDVVPPPAPAIVASLRAAFGEPGAGTASAWPVLVCGSTLEDEEAPLLAAFHNILATHPKAVMILAPRHPERFAEVAAFVEKLGVHMMRRSLWSGEPLAGGVLLLDSIGELAALYSLATVAFVGGSLVPRGGHNILEPALYGVPVVTGNHYENFRDIVNFFLSRNAVRVVGLAELPLVFMDLIGNEAERTTLGRNALAALESQRGATERTIRALAELMSRPAEHAGAPAAGRP